MQGSEVSRSWKSYGTLGSEERVLMPFVFSISGIPGPVAKWIADFLGFHQRTVKYKKQRTYPIIKVVPAVATQAGILQPPDRTIFWTSECSRS